MSKNTFTADGGQHKVERIRAVADGLRRTGEFESAEMLTAYAERIEADERAVPLAWLEAEPSASLESLQSEYGMFVHSMQFHVGKNKPANRPPSNKLFALFTRPPAQAAQVDGETVGVRLSDLRNLKKYLLGATPTLSGNTSWGEWVELRLERATHPHSPDAADHGRTGVSEVVFRAALQAWIDCKEDDLPCRLLDAIAAALAAQGQGQCGPGFGLSDGDVAALRDAGLKPEEIAGDAVKQQERVSELVHWFARFLRGSANPKWLTSHAMELAYYLATNAGNRHIDVSEIRHAGFKEGLNVTPAERAMLERIGVANPVPPASPAGVPDGLQQVFAIPERCTWTDASDHGRFDDAQKFLAGFGLVIAAPSATPEGGEVRL